MLLLAAMMLAAPASIQAQTVLAQWDFASDNMTGITTGTLSSTVIDGVTYAGHEAVQEAYHWNRIENTSVDLNNGTYGDAYYYGMSWIPNYFDATHLGNDNGYMLLSMFPENPYGYAPPIHAYIAFPAVSTVGTSVVDVEWDQIYRKYYDHCYVDYSTDSDTWHTMEVNVTGIDVEVNSFSSLHVSHTLPLAAGNQSTLYLRLRAYTQGGMNQFGCFWAVDNFTVKSGITSRWRLRGEEYTAGVYGMVPQGFILPPVSWQGKVTNNGAVSQNNVAVNFVHTWAAGTDTAFSQAQGNLACAPERVDTVVYDGGVSLPNAVAGMHTLRSAMSSDALDTSFSTCGYVVSTADSDGLYPWGLDHGVLTAYEAGIEEEMVLVRLSTGNQVTVGTDGQPWQLRGVELVAQANCNAVGAVVEPVLYSTTENPDTFFRWTYRIEEDMLTEVLLGTANHTVTASETNSLTSGYLMGDAVNTIRITFGEPVTLEPNTNYYIGYRLVEGTDFAVASAVTRYPDAEGNMVRFADNPTLAPLGRLLESSMPRLLIWTNLGELANYDASPMIHALVGPAANLPTHTVSIACDGNSRVVESDHPRCDTTLTVHKGSVHTYHISGQGYNELAQVLVDGVAQDDLPTFVYEEPLFNAEGEQYSFIPHVGRILTLADIAANHTIEVVSNPTPAHTVTIVSDSGICLINAVAGDNMCLDDSMTVVFTLNCWTGGSWEYYYDSVFLLDGILVDGSPVEEQWIEGTNNYHITVALDGTDHTVQFLTHKVQWHTISITTNKEVMFLNLDPVGDTTMTSLEYHYFWIEFDSYTSTAAALQNGETSPNCWLRHLYIDGEDYAGRENEYEGLSRYGNHYSLQMYFTADHTIELVFDNPDTYCQPIENLRVANDCRHVSLTWSTAPTIQYVDFYAVDPVTLENRYSIFSGTRNGSANFDLTVDTSVLYRVAISYTCPNGTNVSLDTLVHFEDLDIINHVTIYSIDRYEFADDIDLMEWWYQNIVNAPEPDADSSGHQEENNLTIYGYDGFSCDTLVHRMDNCLVCYGYDPETGEEYTYSSTLKQVFLDGVPVAIDTVVIENYEFYTVSIPYDTAHEVITFYANTTTNGIEEWRTENGEWRAFVVDDHIIVEGAEGSDVTLYDIMGRRLAQQRCDAGGVHFLAPAAGVYLLKVGNTITKKVVVIN